MSEVLVLGAGDFARIVARNVAADGNLVVGFVVDAEYWRPGMIFDGVRVYNPETAQAKGAAAISGIVSPRRMALAEAVGGPAFWYVHPSAAVAWGDVRIGAGAYVGAGAVLDRGADVGRHVVVNRGALVGHDVALRPFCTVGPGANLCGRVEVGRQAMIGAGAVVLEGRTVGVGAIVGACALVTRDVPPRALVMGQPARVVREDCEVWVP